MGVVLVIGLALLALIAVAVSHIVIPIGRAVADLLMRRRSLRARNLGSRLSETIRPVETLPTVPKSGLQRYVVRGGNLFVRMIYGAPFVGAAIVLLVVGAIVGAVAGGDDRPVRRDPTHVRTQQLESDPPAEAPEKGRYEYDDGYEDDDGYDGSCLGDCMDMDSDGRTSDDVDADGDGLYETP